jgi:outer membrane lipoprotein SlyB
MNMKNFALSMTVAAVALVLAGCETPEGTPDRTGTGALAGGALGATTGAIIGNQSGRSGEGALIGGAIGAITGGLIGHAMDQDQQARLRAQAPETLVRVEQGQPLGLADVKAMAKAGVSDEVIISQIRNTHTIYRLSAADIIDLHNSGVSQKVIDFMINTASQGGSSSAAPAQTSATVVYEAPPPVPTETVVVTPGPGYVWIGGEWIWDGRWVWVAGHWGYPPYPGALWVVGYWSHGPRGWRHVRGHWR